MIPFLSHVIHESKKYISLSKPCPMMINTNKKKTLFFVFPYLTSVSEDEKLLKNDIV